MVILKQIVDTCSVRTMNSIVSFFFHLIILKKSLMKTEFYAVVYLLLLTIVACGLIFYGISI